MEGADSAYYIADSSSGANKQVIYDVRSQSLTAPAAISQIEVRFIGKSSSQNVAVNFFVKDSAAGFPAVAESGFTFTAAGAIRTEYFYLSSGALNYVNSLADRRVDFRVSASGNAAYTLSTDQILFIAYP